MGYSALLCKLPHIPEIQRCSTAWICFYISISWLLHHFVLLLVALWNAEWHLAPMEVVRFSSEHTQEVSWGWEIATEVQFLFKWREQLGRFCLGQQQGVSGRILLYFGSCVFFTCLCKGHRTGRIQKYSTSYVKKLTAGVCFRQASYIVRVLSEKKKSQMVWKHTKKAHVNGREWFLNVFSLPVEVNMHKKH